MFAFTRKTDYALVALACLAEQDGSGSPTHLSARQIADQHAVPLSLLMNVLKDLVGGGLLTSTRGATGGYALARPPAGISVSDVIAATEGPVKVMACCEDDEQSACRECSIVVTCPITGSIRHLNDRINGILNRVTLEDLMNRDLGGVAEPSPSRGET